MYRATCQGRYITNRTKHDERNNTTLRFQSNLAALAEPRRSPLHSENANAPRSLGGHTRISRRSSAFTHAPVGEEDKVVGLSVPHPQAAGNAWALHQPIPPRLTNVNIDGETTVELLQTVNDNSPFCSSCMQDLVDLVDLVVLPARNGCGTIMDGYHVNHAARGPATYLSTTRIINSRREIFDTS
ncbi:hypothetical protein IQ07DRAFT_68482 [Pyrenochaeta sp. DS3sAY3a]|nr:hypothetical protein IQ07DRAFT_68482 [Pyrenochaeta sp. DS3sAY3a]